MSYYLHPRRLTWLAIGTTFLLVVSFGYDIPDWTWDLSLIMAGLTYFLAPISWRLMRTGDPDCLIVSIAIAYFVVQVVYDVYCWATGIPPVEMWINLAISGTMYYAMGFVLDYMVE